MTKIQMTIRAISDPDVELTGTVKEETDTGVWLFLANGAEATFFSKTDWKVISALPTTAGTVFRATAGKKNYLVVVTSPTESCDDEFYFCVDVTGTFCWRSAEAFDPDSVQIELDAWV